MDDPSNNAGDSGSASPTDTRRQQTSSTSGRRDQPAPESHQSGDTVRRRTDTTSTTYGTVQTPPPAGGSSYLSESSTFDRGQSRASGQPARSPLLAPERGRSRPRKPSMLRRASSSAQAPHKGEVFSTDDDVTEVEHDAVERQHQQPYSPMTSYSSDSIRQSSSTVRRRTLAPTLSRVQSSRSDGPEEAPIEEDPEEDEPAPRSQSRVEFHEPEPEAEEELEEEDVDEEDDDDDLSDAESFTLKDRQQAINETHPFGIRIWKPALYKKDRSVQKTAEGDIHSSPGGRVNKWLILFNVLWVLPAGFALASLAAGGAVVCFCASIFSPDGRPYAAVLWGLAKYIIYPFGKFVRLEQDEAYLEEDEGEGRSISEYEQWQSGDLDSGRLIFGLDRNRSIIGRSRRSLDSEYSENDSLLGRSRRQQEDEDEEPGQRPKRRYFGRGQWSFGRVVFYMFFYGLLAPSLLIVSAFCWFLVFWIPMGKVTLLLVDHLRRHPLALSFESDDVLPRTSDAPHASILLCTYRAAGLKYWKYTIDGTNIFLFNLIFVVLFVILDWVILDRVLHVEIFLTSPGFLFCASLLSIIPLAYFIGQAVASISAQSSMGLGATINALFGTIVEVFLYCVALTQGKGQLVEGSIIGSIFAGVLFLPGLSMCFGAIKRKTQRFNSRSAGVTSTMLLFAVIAAFGPTLFYQIYGTHELRCSSCIDSPDAPNGASERDCRRCYFSQVPALDDRFYVEAVRPYCYLAAILLFFSYAIGLLFTLRTHAAVIWNTENEEKKHEEHQHSQQTRTSDTRTVGEASGSDVRDSHLYKRILGQSLKQVGLPPGSDGGYPSQNSTGSANPNGAPQTPHMVPPKAGEEGKPNVHVPGFSVLENTNLVRGVTELAATAATIAARDAKAGRRTSGQPSGSAATSSGHHAPHRQGHVAEVDDTADAVPAAHGGHDAPNWSRLKSSVILLGATVLYAIVAEILVDTVDVVLDSYSIDQKFLGITLFALVPNTTEFLNAISFAMNGNIALSMEIGSAYALQVCLLQVPALVLFSAVYPLTPTAEDPDPAHWTFSLLFPQWDMVTTILCVFLLSYMYGEGKSNYFKGSILLLAYLVVIVGFYLSSYADEQMGMERFDTLNTDGTWNNYKTIGRGTGGVAYPA